MEVYLAASGASAKNGKVQTAIILNCAGPQVLEVYDNIAWESRIGFGTSNTKSRLTNSLRNSKREQRPATFRRDTEL